MEKVDSLLKKLKERLINQNLNINFDLFLEKLKNNPEKLKSILYMEESGGEPSIVKYDDKIDKYILIDLSKESPHQRRALCYDMKALNDRKKNKPASSVEEVCIKYGIELINEDEYREIQNIKEMDLKTSSWIKTPENIRNLGGAIFCDRRYNTIFVYHNGADSYYSSRGFRAKLEV